MFFYLLKSRRYHASKKTHNISEKLAKMISCKTAEHAEQRRREMLPTPHVYLCSCQNACDHADNNRILDGFAGLVPTPWTYNPQKKRFRLVAGEIVTCKMPEKARDGSGIVDGHCTTWRTFVRARWLNRHKQTKWM